MAPNNPLTVHGNEKTMNLNTLILTNIQSSPYFKVNLFELKTYHQVIDEIYYKVEHLEPWEKGSRKTAGQTGMCGGVRGVGAGGIVSSAYCLLYKLFTLKLTKKQVIGLITHQDSPYIRGLGFMYIRYTQNPADLWEWYEEYLEDEEELDVKAGGGHVMAIGEMVMQWMTKLEWYSTLFPRIPVPIQKMIEGHLREHNLKKGITAAPPAPVQAEPEPRGRGRDGRRQEGGEFGFGEAERVAKLRESPVRGGSSDRKREGRSTPPFDISKAMERDRHTDGRSQKRRSHEREHDRRRDRSRERRRSRSRDRGHKRSRETSRDRHHRKRSRSRDRHEARSHDKPRHRRSRSREHGHKDSRSREHRESSFDRDLRRERERIKNGR